MQIQLSRGRVARVDKRFRAKLGDGWHFDGRYCARQEWRNGKRRKVYLHRAVVELAGKRWPRVDHKNGDKLDCRLRNLRPASAGQNNCNRGPYGRSGIKGVCWHASGKWEAAIGHAGRRRYLGLFTDKRDAAAAYDRAAVELHGEYAWLNRRAA